MPSKYVLQQRGASGLETKAEVPALENGKIDMSWLPVVGESGAAIIARGSNANGEWIRWADGTQVCWGVVEESAEANATECIATCIFPAAFVSVPVGWVGCGRWETLNLYLYGTTTTWCALRATIGEGNPAFIVPFVFLVIGRWK